MSVFKPSINTKRIPIALSNNSSPSTENSPNTNTFSGMHIKICIYFIALHFILFWFQTSDYIILISYFEFYEEDCNSSLMDESNTSSLGILSPSLIEKQVGKSLIIFIILDTYDL